MLLLVLLGLACLCRPGLGLPNRSQGRDGNLDTWREVEEDREDWRRRDGEESLDSMILGLLQALSLKILDQQKVI